MGINQTGIGFLLGLEYVLDEFIDEDIDDKRLYRSDIQVIEEGIKFEELNIILRRFTEDDINNIRKNLSSKISSLFYPIPRMGKFILEYSGDSETMNYKFYSIITGLRLFKRGNVYLSGWRWPRSNIFLVRNTPSVLMEPYFLKYGDINDIKKIINYVDNIRPLNNKLLTCISRFNKKYEEEGASYNELLDLMICSETLFCDEKNYQNRGAVMGLACSMLIGRDLDEREKIKSDYEDAYKIRNIIIHGGDIVRVNKRAKKKLKNLELLNENISDYIRRSFKQLYISIF